jgi:hypothetical protein
MQWKGRRGGVSPPSCHKKGGEVISSPAVQEKGGSRFAANRVSTIRKKNRNMRAHLCARCPCLRIAIVVVVMHHVRVVGDGVRRWGMCSGTGEEHTYLVVYVRLAWSRIWYAGTSQDRGPNSRTGRKRRR